MDQLSRGHAQTLVDVEPFAVMQAPEMQAVVGQVLHGVGAAPAQRRHGRVIQVHQLLADGELAGITLP